MVEISGRNVYLYGTVWVKQSNGVLRVLSTDDIVLTGTVDSMNIVEFSAGELNSSGQFLRNATGTVYVVGSGEIIAAGQFVPAGSHSVMINAATDVQVLAFAGTGGDKIVADPYIVREDRVVMEPVGTRQIVEANNPTITGARTVFYETTYRKEVGTVTVPVGRRYYTIDIDLALVKESDLNTLNAGRPAASQIAVIGGSPHAGYVYVPKTDYEANSTALTLLEYIPEWARTTANLPRGWTLVESGFEVLHASQFLGEIYDQLPVAERPNYYVKVPYTKIGKSPTDSVVTYAGRSDIKKAIYVKEDAVTYENIGRTRLNTDIKLHQIGWWYTGWKLDLRHSLATTTIASALQPGAFWDDAAWGNRNCILTV